MPTVKQKLIKSRARVRDVAEVYTAEREVNAMLDLLGRKRCLHPIDILIEFSGFAVGALTCELAGEFRTSS
jgi:hypothetical protein